MEPSEYAKMRELIDKCSKGIISIYEEILTQDVRVFGSVFMSVNSTLMLNLPSDIAKKLAENLIPFMYQVVSGGFEDKEDIEAFIKEKGGDPIVKKWDET